MTIDFAVAMGIEQVRNGIVANNDAYILSGLYNLCKNARKNNTQLKALLFGDYNKMRNVLLEAYKENIDEDDIDWLEDYVIEIIKQ